MMFKFIKNRNGTALLVALLVMGVLMAISLALSTLILREIVVTKDLLDAGKAYYAAESGIEVALYNLENKLPGWEPSADGDGYASLKVDDEFKAVAEYKVKNRCKAYPCFDEEDFDIASAEPRQLYDVLDLNESINIPLFVVEVGEEKKVTDFVVEFYAAFNPKNDLSIGSGGLSGWDVVRWKVFGINDSAVPAVTETISDFTALSMLNKADSDQSFSTNATAPSWFGTVSCAGLSQAQKGSRYQTDPVINCVGYTDGWKEISGEGFGQIANVFAGTCPHDMAREYYQYHYVDDEKEVVSINGCYSIKTFLEGHNLNYLSLTNLINPAVFKTTDSAKREAFSKLYFRVELFTDDGAGYTAREVADITSNGYSGNNKQSINVQVKKGSFMPVFHFSLYSTHKEAGHDAAYWYGDAEDGGGPGGS